MQGKCSRRSLLAFWAGSAAISCAMPGVAGQSEAVSFPALWGAFKARFIAKDGRVIDSANKTMTHSESLGVGMLFAAAAQDRRAFDAIAAFALKLQRPDGLHSWSWLPGKGVADENNATDGDIYIAWALVRAARQWGDAALMGRARGILSAVQAKCTVRFKDGIYLLPGAQGFIFDGYSPSGQPVAVVNPSYWVLPAFREFAAVADVSFWHKIHTDALAAMGSAPWSPLGLASDWLELQDPLVPWRERDARFGYEAIRVPLFLCWDGQGSAPTVSAVAKLAQGQTIPAWRNLDGQGAAPYEAPAGFKSICALTLCAVYGSPFTAPAIDDDYYSSSLTLLSALAASQRGWLSS